MTYTYIYTTCHHNYAEITSKWVILCPVTHGRAGLAQPYRDNKINCSGCWTNIIVPNAGIQQHNPWVLYPMSQLNLNHYCVDCILSLKDDSSLHYPAEKTPMGRIPLTYNCPLRLYQQIVLDLRIDTPTDIYYSDISTPVPSYI